MELRSFEQLKRAGGVAPAGWKFDSSDWWLEENGLIMEPPQFPVPPRRYLVTGDRAVTAVLTIHPADKNGDRRWELNDGATLHDVTHLACRSARYRPVSGDGSCSPANVQKAAFPVDPGAQMPAVAGCRQQAAGLRSSAGDRRRRGRLNGARGLAAALEMYHYKYASWQDGHSSE